MLQYSSITVHEVSNRINQPAYHNLNSEIHFWLSTLLNKE
jgi:hypothetical protein